MRDVEILKIAEPILKARLAAQGFLNCEVKSEEDWDGDPVIIITAVLQERPQDALETPKAGIEIQDRLKDEGEMRYVYLYIKTPEDLLEGEHDEDEDEDFELKH